MRYWNNKRLRFRALRSRGVAILIAIVMLCCNLSSVRLNAQTREGLKADYYAAGDEFLVAGLDLLDRYWSEISKSNPAMLRGHVDHYLPIELKQLEHKAADAQMRSFATSFFSARNAKTGLIPYAYDTWLSQGNVQTGNKQPVGLIARGVELCQWFPKDTNLQNQCKAFAEDTIEHFDFQFSSRKKGGMWGWVDVNTGGDPRGQVTLTQDYGSVATAFAYLSQKTRDPKFLWWADQKLEFVWQNRMNPNLPILYDQFTPTQALDRPTERSSDTDTLYYVRSLFDLYAQTSNKKYRDWAMAVTDFWFEKAWNPNWGHFIRKLNPDGSPAVTTIYGDGKYNVLSVLVHAYQVTHDQKYLDRFKQAWETLLKLGQDGFVPEAINAGNRVEEEGIDKQQTMFLEILVSAYKATSDSYFLDQAEVLGNRILKRGESVMRLESGQAGQAFLQLAIARQKSKAHTIVQQPDQSCIRKIWNNVKKANLKLTTGLVVLNQASFFSQH